MGIVGLRPRSRHAPAHAAAALGSARSLRDQHRCCRRRSSALTLTLAGRHTPIAVDIALSLLIVGDHRALSLSHRLCADRAYLRAGAADRRRRLPSGAARHRPRVLRRRRPARAGAVERRLHHRSAALHRPEHRRLRGDAGADRSTLAVFRLHALRQGAARHRRQSSRRAAGRHPHRAVGPDRLPARRRDRRDVRHPDRARSRRFITTPAS